MNEHVLATRCGLNEPITLGRVEPLYRTFSHPSSPRDQDNQNGTAGPAKPARSAHEDTPVAASLVAQTTAQFPGNLRRLRLISDFFAAFASLSAAGVESRMSYLGIPSWTAGHLRRPARSGVETKSTSCILNTKSQPPARGK